MANISVGLNVGDYKAGAAALIQTMGQQTNATLQFADAVLKFNAAGQEVGAVVKGLTDDGEVYTATIKKLANSYELVNLQINKTRQAMADLRAQQNANKYQPELQKGFIGPPVPPTVSGEPGGLGDAFDKVGEKGEKAGQRIFITWQGVVRLFEAQVIKKILASIENALTSAIETAKKFSIQIAEIQTISQKANISTDEWAKGLTDLSSQFGKSQADVAEGAYQALSSQVVKGTDTFKFLAEAMKFGQATATSTADSVKLLTGVIQSFGLSSGDTERVSAILFKTITQGRVRATEMSESFSRIGVLAHQSGVSLEEMSAAFTTLTTRGVKASDASTLLTNIFLKLIRPTDEMKQLLKEWGFASGTAAIASLGFVGVLQKLDVEANKGTSRLGELFNQIRGIKGVLGLTGGAFDDFKKNLADNTKGQEEYNKAASIVGQSVGQRLQVQLQEVKNLFEEDFGRKFITGALRISDAVGGIANGISQLITIVQTVGIAFVTFKAIQIATFTFDAALLGLRSLTAGLFQTNFAMMGTITTTTTLQARFAAFAAANPALVFITIATAVALASNALGIFNDTSKTFDQAGSQITEISKRVVELGDKNLANTRLKDNENKLVQDTQNAYNKKYEIVLQFSRSVFSLSDKMKQRAVDNMKDTTDTLKVTSKTYTDSLQKNISDFREKANEAKQLIKDSLKYSEDIQNHVGKTVFQKKLEFASGGETDPLTGFIFNDQKQQLIQQRIAKLTDEAKAEYAKSTKEGVIEARKLYSEIEKLQAQLFEHQTQNQKKVFDSQVASGQQQPTSFDSFGRARYEFVVRTVDFEKQMNALAQERIELEEKFRASQKARQEAQEKEIEKEKERLRTLQLYIKQAADFSALDKKGEVKEEFKKDPAKAIAQFDEIIAKINAAAGPDALKSNFQFFADLYKQRKSIVVEAETAIRAEQAKTLQEFTTKAKEAAIDQTKKAKEDFGKFEGGIKEGITRLDEVLAGLREKSGRADGAAILGFKKQDIPFFGSDEKNKIKDSEESRVKAVEAINALQAANDAFNKDRTPEKAAELKVRIDELSAAYEKYIRIRTGGENIRNTTLPGEGGGVAVEQRLDQARAAIAKIAEGVLGQQDVASQLKQAQTAANGLDNIINKIPASMKEFADKSQENIPRVATSLQGLGTQVEEIVQKFIKLNEELQKLKIGTPEIRGERNVPGNMFGGSPRYMNYGGFVGRGSDQIPAMLSPDEFIMNGQATKSFAPILKAMNDGLIPKYMSKGGPVTNVGDITVNVHGGATDEITVRKIAQGLRRELRRGTITLD